MRTPVISSIINVVPDKSIADDKELSALIKAIDANDISLKGQGYDVTQKDYDRVKETRSIVRQGGGGQAVIPDYASAKDVAIDLLRFMATDICQEECYIKECYGLTSAMEYSMEKYTQLSNYVQDIHLSKQAILQSSTLPMKALPSTTSFPYGIKSFYSIDLDLDRLEVLISAGQRTAQKIYQDEIDYWANSKSKWDQMISGNNNW